MHPYLSNGKGSENSEESHKIEHEIKRIQNYILDKQEKIKEKVKKTEDIKRGIRPKGDKFRL